MKIQNQVVSLELAKKLKEAGYPQDKSTFFQWLDFKTDSKISDTYLFYKDDDKCLIGFVYYDNGIAAPTATEIDEQLPNYISETPDGFYLHTARWHEEAAKEPYQCFYKSAKGNILKVYENFAEFGGNTEADARAKMWLYLKENNLLRNL